MFYSNFVVVDRELADVKIHINRSMINVTRSFWEERYDHIIIVVVMI